jgi:hypothetical protein
MARRTSLGTAKWAMSLRGGGVNTGENGITGMTFFFREL